MPRKKKKSKNINGMGSIRQLDNGNWEYRFTMPDRKADGSIDRRSVTANTGEQAIERGRKIISEYQSLPTTYVSPEALTWGLWVEKWWAQHVTEVRGSTVSTDRIIKNHIVNALQAPYDKYTLGSILLIGVRLHHFKLLLKVLQDMGKSDVTLKKVRSMSSHMFNEAVDQGLMPQNPVASMKKRKRPGQVKLAIDEKDAFSPDEVEKILHAFDDLASQTDMSKMLSSRLQAARAMVVLLFSGLRKGELLALSPRRVDEDGAGISVTNSINMEDGKPVIGPPKSKASIRRAEVSRVARPVLAQLRKATPDGGLLLRSAQASTKVYCASGFNRAYFGFLKTVDGVRPLPPHCCRHTYATMLAAVGVAPAVIMEVMGHEDYKLTSDVYTHVKLYMTPEAIEKVKKWGVGDFSHG